MSHATTQIEDLVLMKCSVRLVHNQIRRVFLCVRPANDIIKMLCMRILTDSCINHMSIRGLYMSAHYRTVWVGRCHGWLVLKYVSIVSYVLAVTR
jgi:hypothetical protein